MSATPEPTLSDSMGKLPPLAKAWVRYLLGFSISVGVGLAPYLGKIKVPLFTPLLALIPLSIQNIAIPLATAFMGVIAVVVQWNRKATPKTWHFAATLGGAILSLLLLTAIEMTAVAHIQVPAVGESVAFAVGFANPVKPPCENMGREQCIATKLCFDETAIASYYGDPQVNMTKLLLILSYVSFMSLFGLLVGLLLLRERSR